jgi:hypothetical protein
LKPLHYQLGDIYDALIEISDDNTLTGSPGNTSQALAKGISSFKFVVSLVVWYDILFEVNMTSKQLQMKEFYTMPPISWKKPVSFLQTA